MKTRYLAAAFAAFSLALFLTGCSNSSSQTESSGSPAPAVTAESSSEAPKQNNAAVKPAEIGSDLTVGILPVTAHAGDKAVPVPVQIWNNPGFAAGGIQLYYDSKLMPVTTESNNEFTDAPGGKCDLGNAAEDFLKSCLVGTENHVIAFGCMGSVNSTEDGTIFTVYFDIPENAPAGQSFSLTCVIDSLNDVEKNKLNPKTLDGCITIE